MIQLIIFGSIQTALGTIPHPEDVAPDLRADSNSFFYVDHEAHHQNEDRNPSALPWNVDYLWTPQLDGDGLDDQIPAKRAAQNFIRLGRNRANDAFMRLGRSDHQGFIRFGRSSPGNRDRRTNGFFGAGRDNLEHFMATGGSNNGNDDNMRFGRRGDKFIRFGRSQAKSFVGNGNNYQNELDRENSKRHEEFDGKTTRGFIRLGRARLDNNFIRLGKKSNGDSVHWGSAQLPTSGLGKNSQNDNEVFTPSILDIDAFENLNQKRSNPLGMADNDLSNEN